MQGVGKRTTMDERLAIERVIEDTWRYVCQTLAACLRFTTTNDHLLVPKGLFPARDERHHRGI